MRTAKDEVFAINPDLNVVYTTWEDGSRYRRLEGWWRHMEQREWVEPAGNETLLRLQKKGLHLARVEHVSFTVAGKVIYLYDTPEGFAEDIGLPGEHNVANGSGYLSLHAFTRITNEGHMTCCVVRNLETQTDQRYDFAIQTDIVLEQEAVFVHYCLGPRQKETDYDLKPGFTVFNTAIIGRLRG